MMNPVNLHSHYLTKVLTSSVYDVAIETPLEPARNLSRRLNNHILLKREDLQPVFRLKFAVHITRWQVYRQKSARKV